LTERAYLRSHKDGKKQFEEKDVEGEGERDGEGMSVWRREEGSY
jgi:hypothetical protein